MPYAPSGSNGNKDREDTEYADLLIITYFVLTIILQLKSF
jgi:hypothetical protein